MKEETLHTKEKHHNKLAKRIIIACVSLIMTIILFPLLLAAAIYLPPVQNWLVDKAAEYASETTGMEIGVDNVRLSYPLDLAVNGVTCYRPNDSIPSLTDTVAEVKRCVVDVELLPLIDGIIQVNNAELQEIKMNTVDFIDAVRLNGFVKRIAIDGIRPVVDVNLNKETVNVQCVTIDNADVTVAMADSVPEDTTKSEANWQVKVRKVSINKSSVDVVLPKDGGNIALRDFSLNADSLIYGDNKVRVAATLKTPVSSLYAKVDMDLTAFADESPGHMEAVIDGSIGHDDVLWAMGLADAPEQIKKAWPYFPLNIKADVRGNIQKVFIPLFNVSIPNTFALSANGTTEGFMALADDIYSHDFKADMHVELNTYNLNFVKTFLDRSTAKMINIPAMKAVADISAFGPDYAIDLKANEGRGSVKADARVNIAEMRYNANVITQRLNISHFVRGMQLGEFTGKLTANGKGTDILSRKTRLNATAKVNHFIYGGYALNNIDATAEVRNGRADVDIISHNKLADGHITLDALMDTRSLNATLATDLNKIDLKALGVMDTRLDISLCTHVDVESDFKDYYKVQGMVSDIIITDTGRTYRPADIVMDVLTRRDTTIARIDCGDFLLHLNAQGGYKQLMGVSDKLINTMSRQWDMRTIDQAEMRKYLPVMTMKMNCSQDNPLYYLVKYMDVDYDHLEMDLNTSPADGINGCVMMQGMRTQGVQLDSIDIDIKSYNDPMKIMYDARIKNAAPNDYVFEVLLNGKLLEHGILTGGVFYDANHDVGLMIGTEATMEENGIRFKLLPKEPIIAYKPFTLNSDNYVFLANNNRISADVRLTAADGTGIQLYSTMPEDEEDEEAMSRLQDMTLSIMKLDLSKLLAAIPYAPNIDGMLNGDVHVVQEADKSLSLSSDLVCRNMKYEGCEIGNLGTQFVYMPNDDGTSHHINGITTLNDREVAQIEGSYNIETDNIAAEVSMDKFPLEIANGFIPDQIIGFLGTADGVLSIHGTTAKPVVNGELFLEGAKLISIPYGITMRMDDDPVLIQDSKLLLENFQLYSNNDQPLVIRGDVDFSDTEHIKTNLRMRTENFLLIDAKENRRSEAYGKAYINAFATIKGELDKLRMRGRLEVLPTTNLYYILRDSPLTTDNRLQELVTFTDLTAEEPITVMRPTVDGMEINMSIIVHNGSHIKCWLNDQHSNYLDIIGEGELNMKYMNEEMSLTGRYTITEGEMKYSLPVIPLKTFKITEGSYIEFNGDMMNPRLDIIAKERSKSSVNINNVNQIVLFNTGVHITRTLNDMGLEFLIEAPENKTLQDELNAKSLEERSKLAVTMLTTGMYLDDGNTKPFSMNSALNSFLQSEINNIAGGALKTLDLSFGMDNSTEEDGTMHTNYNFSFAKRFWNNRLAISVGGKISSGPDVYGQNKTFFDNVEAQYRLSDESNQYLNLFYKHSVYDFLEGYVGQYGAGYMWKKKSQYLKDIFNMKNTSPAPQRQQGATTPMRQQGADNAVRQQNVTIPLNQANDSTISK